MIKITKDYKMIKDILLNDKEMFDRISDDYTNPENFNPSKVNWIGFFENNKCLGLLMVHEESSIVLNIHMHIPKKYRGKRSFEIGHGMIEYLCTYCDERFVKINAKIPTIYPDVIRFAEKCGFEMCGIDTKSFLKNSKYYNRFCFEKIIK
jgi:hypothetical protein